MSTNAKNMLNWKACIATYRLAGSYRLAECEEQILKVMAGLIIGKGC